MRTKTLGGHRRASSASRPSLPTIPLLSTTDQDECNATMFETSSSESDDGPRDFPMADCIDQHESIDLLDKEICMCCNKGGGVLVCGEKGCPVTLHAKCIDSEPKFDDLGNFYCPYCWYKRAVERCQELRKKAVIAKKALSSFLDKNAVTSDKTLQTEDAAKRKEFLVGDGISLDGDNRHGTDGVHSQHLQPKLNQPRKLHKADSDQYEMALEGRAVADGDSGARGEEEMPVHIKPVQDSMNWQKFDKPDISETHESSFSEGKGTEDSRHNVEDGHERIVEVGEEAEPISGSCLGKHTDGHSPNVAFAKWTQESVAKSAENKGRIKHKGKVPQREKKVSETGSSVSETNDSESEAISVKMGRVKRKIQTRACTQKVASVRKSLLQEHNTAGKNDSDINEEVTSSKTLREPQRSPKHVKNRSSLTAKRRPLFWTVEEENALKEGVLRFSAENQNIPWRKILEFGCRVFDKTRTPIDLKDKWRKIASKEGCK